MLSSKVSKKQINLKQTLNTLPEKPQFKERFKNTHALKVPQGLSLGSIIEPLACNNWFLLGDAASLIDPFSGERVANAIRRGRLAAERIYLASRTKNYLKEKSIKYENEIYKRVGLEMKISKQLQNFCRYPWLFDF